MARDARREEEKAKKEKALQEAKDKALQELEGDGAGSKRSADTGDEAAAKKPKTEVKGFVKAEGETINAAPTDGSRLPSVCLSLYRGVSGCTRLCVSACVRAAGASVVSPARPASPWGSRRL